MLETNLPETEKFSKKDFLSVNKIITEDFSNNQENLIMILQAIQKKYNYLPQTMLTYLSVQMNVPYSKIFGITTFYSSFSLKPRGRNIISLCLGTACHVRGAERTAERIEASLDILDGKTTKDKKFTLESVRCIGCCSLGPVIKINEDFYGRISTEKVKKIFMKYQ